jgi:hypothetical protein
MNVRLPPPRRGIGPLRRPTTGENQCSTVSPNGSPGGFLGDHGDIGNWHCPLGIAALSVESVIILLVLLAAAGAWQARIRAASVATASRPAARPTPQYTRSA